MVIDIPHITISDKWLRLIQPIDDYYLDCILSDFQAWHVSQELNPEYAEKLLYLNVGEEKLLVIKGWISKSMIAAQTLDGKRLFIGAAVDHFDEAKFAKEWVEIT